MIDTIRVRQWTGSPWVLAGPIRAVARWPRTLQIGVGILVAWVVATLVAPFVLPHGPETVLYGKKLLAPSTEFPLGTDPMGRDLLARVIGAFRYDLAIALSGVAIAMAAGIALGAIAANTRAIVDDLIMRGLDVLSAFPSFILALTLAGALGAGMWNLVVAIGVVFTPAYARLVRGQMLAERSKQYVDAAKVMGLPRTQIVLRHLLPNCLGPVVTQATNNFATAIMIAAGISYLGFGVRPPAPEWGLMISEGAGYIVSGEWWTAFFPGAAIISVVTSCVLIDDGIRQRAGSRQA